MPNHQQNPISPYLAQPARNKRKNATQACDSCRRRKRQCDAQRPVCSSCQKVNLGCTYNRNGLKRGRKANSTHQGLGAPCTTFKSTECSSADISGQHSESNSTLNNFTSMDPFSREVTDHLVDLFFEHCFQDFDFFSPLEFLRKYVRGTISQELLYAVCASGASFSDHPAIAKTPPSSNGQIYVDRVKARMIYLISQESVDVIHTLMILARAEYDAGHAQKGFRLEAMAIGMVPELGLHRSQAPEKPFQSEAERITFEVGFRTFAVAVTYDWFKSLVWGMPGMLEHMLIEWQSAGLQQGWWIERVSSNTEREQQRIESLDDYTIGILHRIHRPQRLRGAETKIHLWQLVDVGRLVRKVCQNMSSSGYKEDQHLKVGQVIEGAGSTATSTKMTTSRQHSVQGEYRQAENALDHWRETLPQDLQPSRIKDMVSRVDTYGFVLTGYYYALVIQLHRPFLLKASMSISRCKKKLSEEAEVDMEEELKQRIGRNELQMLETCLTKCLAAADGMLAIIEQFTNEDIRFRGYAFTFPIFIAGTVRRLT
ncbi:hypothetical protein BGZ96_001411 [Linnemannia gamsii]|uniref:Zn(2)-C6 fungal-type domain-containing protein n=1 Tax=Linnemannia gamsii TaxID=64522 RepID=A0ABQ7JMJ6_9FUNG|nr:hypothetical protein BGZ96_001411 [Linnemannia gamsii]